MQPLSIFALVLASVVAYFLFPFILRRFVKDQNGNHLPPGPGVRYLFFRKYPELAFDAWAKKYGSLFSFWMGGQFVVVISDPLIAKELLVVNGASFSSRKPSFIKSQMILRGRAITGSEYGEKWRQHRRIAQRVLTPKAISGYASALDYEACDLVRSLFQESLGGELPVDPAVLAGRYAINSMFFITMGMRIDSNTAPLMKKSLDMAKEYDLLGAPFANAVDYVKPLQWIPTSMRARARQLHDDILNVYGGMILQVKARMDAGEEVPDCLVKTLLEIQKEENLDWEDICMLVAVFPIGGDGGTDWFLAVIPQFPDVQKRAHEELDRVVGHGRWPCFEDEPNMPYLRAVIKEILRIYSPFWIPSPHYTTQDYSGNGVYIPKDTVVALNLYTMHHNEELYPDASSFNPDRYIGNHLSSAESVNLSNVLERDHWAFGAGRRVCPGIRVAERALWLAVAKLLWAFRFETIPGEAISLEDYQGGSSRQPLPSRVKFLPRLEKLDEMFRETKGIAERGSLT